MRDLFVLILVTGEIIWVCIHLGRRISANAKALYEHTHWNVHPDGDNKPHTHKKKR